MLSGYPHLEEVWWFGEGVLPELARRGLWSPPDGYTAETGPVSVLAASLGLEMVSLQQLPATGGSVTGDSGCDPKRGV